LDRLKNKVVIVTGASSGIGLACAKRFAECGAKVVFAAREREKISPLLKMLREKGCIVHFIRTDVREPEDCRWMVAETEGLFGSPHILVNNAGIAMRALFSDSDPCVVREVMDTNFWGAVNCTRFALPHLIRNQGSLITVSSVTGKAPLPGRSGYCASKYALEGFMAALRLENRNNGLHVMVVRPGFTNTNIRRSALNQYGLPQMESPRDEEKMMSPEEVAARILRGLLRREREFTLTGQGKLMLILHKLFPSLTEHLICREMAREAEPMFGTREITQPLFGRNYKSVSEKDRARPAAYTRERQKRNPQPGETAE